MKHEERDPELERMLKRLRDEDPSPEQLQSWQNAVALKRRRRFNFRVPITLQWVTALTLGFAIGAIVFKRPASEPSPSGTIEYAYTQPESGGSP